ncbi:MAG: ABC transporter permease, partial [Candidatus Bathyarchaeota archaeon]|nr:ABC transporter permease [Candidatus Bathyarchaeota archaeon]
MSTLNNLLGFRYLRWQRILALAIMVSAASFLFSFTALSLIGFHEGFTAYLGEGEDIIVVYNFRSRTPYTGLVPAYLAEKLAAINGVLATSPEVIAPCIVDGEAVFLRGIMPEVFTEFGALKIVEGSFLSECDINSAVAGERIARRLGLEVGDKVLLCGVLSERYLELRIKGIFRANSMLDDEILAPLYVGQWLRGADYNHVTLIRLKIDGDIATLDDILKVIEAEASGEVEPSPPQQAPK